MKRNNGLFQTFWSLTTSLISLFSTANVFAALDASENWPEFRGPTGDGHAKAVNLPLNWSETTNIVWKTALHDEGWSSPVIWGNQIWVTSATADGKSLFALCLDRDSGKIIHDVKVFEVETPLSISSANTYASPTSIIESGRAYVHYGTYGTACIDTKTAKILWSRRDLNCDHEVGPGSSLAWDGGRIVFNVDGRDQQYVIALDKNTGKTVWKTTRSIDYSKIPNYSRKSFSMPTVVTVEGRNELVSVGGQGIMAYDAASGEEIWKIRHKGWSIVTRPVCGRGFAFLTMDYDHPELWAVRLDGHGDITDTKIAWKLAKNVPKTPSPLLIEDLLYIVSDQGIVTCLEADSGKVIWEQSLGGNFGVSPLFANDRIYFFGRKGTTTVMAPGRTANILATNRMDWTVMASPAVADNAIFVRTQTHLYRVGEKK